ncbi:MAG: tetratricopeptide repeat-containing glycosyltransferase family protein [Thermodesulfovibrionales bacterium]|nr:tetratricopeptide repeat-containing glycosyltransferase family protein [Thermodesulfovibrionales bacterium]
MIKIKKKHIKAISDALEMAHRYSQEENLEESEYIYRKILREQPNDSQGCVGLAFVLHKKGWIDEALRYYQKALMLNPKLADAVYNLGNIFQQKGRLDEAIRYYERAIKLDPHNALAYNNLGSVLQQKGQFDEAIVFYQKAITHNQGLLSAYNNLGLAFHEKGLFQEAMECHKKALSLNPDHPTVHFNIAGSLLLHGDFQEGWKEYEWRKKMHGYKGCRFIQPLWDGSDVQGHTIMLYSEKGYEGFGDTIQFIRYATLIAKRGVKVFAECQRELKSLLRSVEGVEQVFSKDETLPEFDLTCPYLSLPFVFGTTVEIIPSKTPYIMTNPVLIQNWRDKIQRDNSELKIGLVWAGDLRHPRSRYRSCELAAFSPLSQISDISVYSLQKGEASKEASNPPEGLKFFDYTEDFTDFSDAAALIENLDLVISVDTAGAHLAGALGRPVWTLLPFVPEWRWLLDRKDSPWYPTMKIFRQPYPGDWKSVISCITEELRKKVNEKAISRDVLEH